MERVSTWLRHGAQTMTAERISGSIKGVDLFSDFTDVLNAHAEKRGAGADRVRGVSGPWMCLMSPESIDLIWVRRRNRRRGVRQDARILERIP